MTQSYPFVAELTFKVNQKYNSKNFDKNIRSLC